MNFKQFILAGTLVALLTAACPASADPEALRTLARITENLEHYPTEEQKTVLKAILDSYESSEEEAAIAMALANMRNTVTAGDAERLHDIVDDDLADATARKLAEILLKIDSSPGDDDKLTLAALATLAGE